MWQLIIYTFQNVFSKRNFCDFPVKFVIVVKKLMSCFKCTIVCHMRKDQRSGRCRCKGSLQRHFSQISCLLKNMMTWKNKRNNCDKTAKTTRTQRHAGATPSKTISIHSKTSNTFSLGPQTSIPSETSDASAKLKVAITTKAQRETLSQAFATVSL